jgi:hypothetical protein
LSVFYFLYYFVRVGLQKSWDLLMS